MRSRWRISKKGQIGAIIVAVALVVLSLSFFVQWRSEEETSFNNILFFALVNVNIIALLVLVVLVVRNVIKLMFERRRGILGAKLRSRLMGSFVLIALIPIGISFIVASGLINQAMQGWFSTQIDTIVGSSLTMARQYVSGAKLSVEAAAGRVHKDLSRLGVSSIESAHGINDRLEDLRHLNGLYAIKIISRDGAIVAESSHATAGVDSFAEPPLDAEAVEQAFDSHKELRVEERGASQFIRFYAPLGSLVVVSSYRMDPEMVHAQSVVNEAFSEYEQLKLFKRPLRTNFFLILALFNLLTLFGAIWIAFFVSKQITGPIQRLAEGTRRVARGIYDFRLDPARDDEVGFLINSFNQMLQDLKGSKEEAESRGLLIQAILTNLAVGVVALDPEKRVTAVNSAAHSLLELEVDANLSAGLPLSELLKRSLLDVVGAALDALGPSEGEVGGAVAAEVEFRMQSGGRELIIVCTAGRIVGKESKSLGYVLLFDDVTELSRSQHLAAWRDVARRIAHEIKNPLTPLQLSAQRLERLLQGGEHASAVTESTRSIVEHVEIIKRLANEFSEYGRMPTAQFVSTDLSALLSNVIRSFQNDHPDVRFSYDADGKIPEMLLDPDQVRGVLINIYANAVAAVRSHQPSGGALITTSLAFDRKSSRARIDIIDNGPGIPAEDKNRVFEPYFTTKRGGTGLGLAIVSSVVSDHQGEVRIFDAKPHGVHFVLVLPQHPQSTTVRKLAGV
jgi:two-component system nitrogen regulation sensor histidine kinase NtrY